MESAEQGEWRILKTNLLYFIVLLRASIISSAIFLIYPSVHLKNLDSTVTGKESCIPYIYFASKN